MSSFDVPISPTCILVGIDEFIIPSCNLNVSM